MPQQQNGRVSAPRCGLACAWGLAALILAVMGTPSVVCADPLDTVVVKDLGLVGGREAVWVYRYRIEGEDDLRLLRFAYRLTDERAPQRFRGLVGLGAVNGRIAAAAVSGNDFHVIFADGAHRRYGRRPGDVQLNLPDACAPLALAGDAAEQVVYALVPTVVAVQLPETAAPDQPQPATTPVAEDVVATEPEPDETSPPFSIVRFARGAWHRDRLGPDALRLRSPCWLSADRGRLTLVIAGQSGDGGVRHVSSDGEGWDAPVTIPGVEATDILTLVSEDEKVALVTISMGRGANAAVLWFSDEGIARRDVLEESAGAVAAGQLGQQLVLAFDGAGGESQIGVWPLHGGPPSEQPAEIPALVPRPRAWIDSETVVLAYAGMGALVIVVVARRRRSIAVHEYRQPGGSLLQDGTGGLNDIQFDELFRPDPGKGALITVWQQRFAQRSRKIQQDGQRAAWTGMEQRPPEGEPLQVCVCNPGFLLESGCQVLNHGIIPVLTPEVVVPTGAYDLYGIGVDLDHGDVEGSSPQVINQHHFFPGIYPHTV